MCEVSMKYIEPDGRGNDFKIAIFNIFFKMSLFEIQMAFFKTYHRQNLNLIIFAP